MNKAEIFSFPMVLGWGVGDRVFLRGFLMKKMEPKN
jgi:hypothetical protein